ncbi:hypothetical protein [Algoriphagus vanfongensis]|nr:hypothetical protein [Algoriphagus vanfongensis]
MISGSTLLPINIADAEQRRMMKLELLEKQHNKIHSNNARGDTGLGED